MTIVMNVRRRDQADTYHHFSIEITLKQHHDIWALLKLCYYVSTGYRLYSNVIPNVDIDFFLYF